MKVDEVDATLGAVVTDVSLATLDEDDWRGVLDAFHEHGVLVFPGQHLDRDEQVRFARRFGRFERTKEGRATSDFDVSNVRRDGSLESDAQSKRLQQLSVNEGWHSDSSYHAVAAKASMLSAHQVPSHAGATEFADMRAAYDVLPAELLARIEGRRGAHSIRWSNARVGVTYESGLIDDTPAWHPIVAVHPITGRRSLFIGRHLFRIEGMSDDEAVRLSDELIELACRPPRVYMHSWSIGDLVVWDNRCVLHRARPWDVSEPRALVGSRIAGDGDNEWAADEV